MSAVQETFGVRLDLRALFETPTAAGLSARLGEQPDVVQSDDVNSDGGQADGDLLDVLLPLRARGTEAPLFCVHPVLGLGWGYAALLRRLDPRRPLYGLQASGIRRPDARPASIRAMARDYVARIREVQPAGPYHLLGWSLGGTVAHAMAELLQRDGERVAFLALLDSYPVAVAQDPEALDAEAEQEVLGALLPGAGPAVRELVEQGADRQRILALLREENARRLQVDEQVVGALLDTAVHSSRLVLDHVPGTVDGDLVFVTATGGRPADAPTARAAWQAHLTGEIHEYRVDCRHAELLGPQGLAGLGRMLTERLGHDA